MINLERNPALVDLRGRPRTGRGEKTNSPSRTLSDGTIGRMGSSHEAARMNCYAAFAQAQQLENEGDNDAALAAYTELVRAARAAHSSTLTYDETSGPGANAEIIDSVPPTALVVSVALNSLGGLLLDARKLSDASVAFEDSLSVWGANGAAPGRSHGPYGRPARPKWLIWPRLATPKRCPGPSLALLKPARREAIGERPLWAIGHWARIDWAIGHWGIGPPSPGSGATHFRRRQAPVNMLKKSPVNLALVPAGSALRLDGQTWWNRWLRTRLTRAL